MTELLFHIWKRRVPLVAIWLVVMAIVLIRLVAMDNVYTSAALLTPLPLEQVEGSDDVGLGTPTVRSILAAGSTRDDFAVVAFLKSRRLMDEVVRRAELKRELFPSRWDFEGGRWIAGRGGEPTDAEARRALAPRVGVDYDSFTRLLSFEVQWPSPEEARDVAVAYLDAADALLRDAAMEEGERRIAELEREMESAAVGEVGASLAEAMTRAISSLASIRARADYAFRVIDPPVVPDRKSWPPRLTLLLLMGVVTAALEVGFVAARYVRAIRSAGAPTETASAGTHAQT